MSLTGDLQYELDGASETHDPSQPSTSTCPYLPGQTVNTLYIPVEQSLRKRSASLTSLREDDFKTMDPASKFVSPKPASTPTPPEAPRRIGTAPLRITQHKRSARSLSPGSGWIFPRKLFSRRSSTSSLKGVQVTPPEDARSVRSEGSRSRDISPESLRRFLVEHAPLEQGHGGNDRPSLYIPEDIAEENEDDDNFATSAVSETMQFTGLSPPPRRFITSAATTTTSSDAASSGSGPHLRVPAVPTRPPPRAPPLETPATAGAQSRFFPSTTSTSQQHSPLSPECTSPPGIYWHSDDEDDDDDDDDDDLPANDEDLFPLPGMAVSTSTTTNSTNYRKNTTTNTGSNSSNNPFARNLAASLSAYSLPRTADSERKHSPAGQPPQQQMQMQTQTAAALASDVAVGSPSLLSSPIPDSGLEKLVSELGWMAEFIRGGCA